MSVRPTAVQVASLSNYITDAELLAFNIESKVPFDQRANDYDDTMMILTLLGKATPTTNHTFYHDEFGSIINSFTLNYASGSGLTRVYTVAPSSVLTVNGNNYSPAVIGSTIQFPDANDTQATIENVVFTGGLFEVTVNFYTGATVPTGSGLEVFYINRQEARGMDISTKGQFGSFPRRYSNSTIRMFEYQEFDGYDFQKIWYEVPMEGGGTGYAWQFKEHYDLKKRFQTFRVSSMFLSQKGTSTDSAGNQYLNGEGILPYIKNNGGANIGYQKGTKSYQDWVRVVRYLDANGGDVENFVFAGFDAREEDNRWMQDFNKNGAISYGAFGFDQEKAINYGFTGSFEISGYTFHPRTVRAFSNPFHMGAGKGLYRDLNLVIPAGKTTSAGEDRDSIELRYFANGNQNYSYEDFVVGGASSLAQKTDTSNSVKRVIRSAEGVELFGVNRFAIFQGL